jgi:hypothetical protein
MLSTTHIVVIRVNCSIYENRLQSIEVVITQVEWKHCSIALQVGRKFKTDHVVRRLLKLINKE